MNIEDKCSSFQGILLLASLALNIIDLVNSHMEATPSQSSQTTKPVKKSKLPATIGAIIGFVVAYLAVQLLFFKQPTFDKTMMKVAGELNKSCPIMVDKETRLDNATPLENNIFQYNYTIIHYEKSQVNETTLVDAIEPRLVNNVRTNPDLRVFREHQTTLAYSYRDKNGVFILKILVTPEKYK